MANIQTVGWGWGCRAVTSGTTNLTKLFFKCEIKKQFSDKNKIPATHKAFNVLTNIWVSGSMLTN